MLSVFESVGPLTLLFLVRLCQHHHSTRRVPPPRFWRARLLTLLFLARLASSPNRSLLPIAVRPSISVIHCVALINLNNTCYPPLCLSKVNLAELLIRSPVRPLFILPARPLSSAPIQSGTLPESAVDQSFRPCRKGGCPRTMLARLPFSNSRPLLFSPTDH
jgi:hypothetical protein